MVRLVNPFSLLAVEEKLEASLLAAEKKEKDEKKENQRPRRLPKSISNGGSVKSSNQPKGPADSVSVSSSTSHNDHDQNKEADPDNEGWQLVQHQTRKKGPRNGSHPQTQDKLGATVNNRVNVEEGIRQLQEVARGMNGSQGSVQHRQPNINGSARRRLGKKKDNAGDADAAGQDQQVQATKEAAAATEAALPEEKLTVTYTLEEFEKIKKNGHSSNKSEEQPHQSAEQSADKDNSFKGKDNGSKRKDTSSKVGKDNGFKGRRNQNGGNRFNGEVGDVSGATEEKAAEILFNLNLDDFPVLGKAL